ncbi:unnamed protein product [Diabrotica balteata]|uniref:Peptidase S1 domain-containing protein n=1 Tax=Diabrotica balteata TaxID=107213 RepID=A0A9N9T8S5_DIABA|nr:unnamed protein product [Diabrotica balteata]
MGNFTWSIALVIFTLLLNNNPLADKQYRIFGGYEAKIEDHPWIVELRLLSKHYCGGTLLNEDTVLTAAHCLDSYEQEQARLLRFWEKVQSDEDEAIPDSEDEVQLDNNGESCHDTDTKPR